MSTSHGTRSAIGNGSLILRGLAAAWFGFSGVGRAAPKDARPAKPTSGGGDTRRAELVARGDAIVERLRRTKTKSESLRSALNAIRDELAWRTDRYLARAAAWGPEVMCIEGDYEAAIELAHKLGRDYGSPKKNKPDDPSNPMADYPYLVGTVLMEEAFRLDVTKDREKIIMLLTGVGSGKEEYVPGALDYLFRAVRHHPIEDISKAASKKRRTVSDFLEKHYKMSTGLDYSKAVVADTEAAARTKKRLIGSVIPRLDFQQVPVRRCLTSLMDMIRKADPEKKGAEIVVKGSWAEVPVTRDAKTGQRVPMPGEPASEEHGLHITFTARYISGWEALVVLSLVGDCLLEIDKDGRVIFAKKAEPKP